MNTQLSNLPDVISPSVLAKYFQVNRTTLWRWEKTNSRFPKAKRFSARKTGYLRSEVEKYLNSL
jgi:predicted DNA-binding transcriptional regulator AlpA